MPSEVGHGVEVIVLVDQNRRDMGFVEYPILDLADLLSGKNKGIAGALLELLNQTHASGYMFANDPEATQSSDLPRWYIDPKTREARSITTP